MWAAAIEELVQGQFLIPALAHSLWQGLVLSVMLLAALRRVPVKRPALRYGWCCVALAGLVCSVGATMALMAYLDNLPAHTAPPETMSVSAAAATAGGEAAEAPAAASSTTTSPTVHPPATILGRAGGRPT